MLNHSLAKINHQVGFFRDCCSQKFDFFLFVVPMSRPIQETTPNYPSSSLRAKNWDKIEAQIKKDEKDNKEDMGDANAYVLFFD